MKWNMISSMSQDESTWPRDVRRKAEECRQAGFSPVVTGEPGGRWEVVVEGAHLRAAAHYAFRSGKTRYCGGALSVDGREGPLARDMDHLRELWQQHEEGAAPPPLLMVLQDDGSPVPLPVKAAADTMRIAAGDRVEVRAGRSGSHWAVGFDLPGGDGLRMVFTRYRGREEWNVDSRAPVQLVLGGQDRSAEAEGQLGKAMSLLAAHQAEAPAGVSAVQHQASFRSTGVETRKMVVIRE